MKKNHSIVVIPCELVTETDLAYLVFDGRKSAWVPKSQCEYEDGELQIPEWLAVDKGLV